MKRIFVLAFGISILYACNNRTESSQSNENTEGTAPNVINPNNSDTAMRNNTSAQLSAAVDRMINQMRALTPTGDDDNDFAMMMLVHHGGAMDLARVEIGNGRDSGMVAMAKSIDSVSRKEMAELDSFLAKNKPDQRPSSSNASASGFHAAVMKMMDTTSLKKITHSGNIDDDFAAMMIRHHEDGIAMSKLYLKSAKSGAMKKMANKIITNQPKDIRKLQELEDRVK